MPTVTRLASLAIFTLASSFVNAQQYAGNPIPNRLDTAVEGASICYFRITNPSNPSGPATTLINYFSTPNNQTQNSANVQRAVIVLHGSNRDPWNYWMDMYQGLGNATVYDSNVNENSVAIMAPYFPNEGDENVGYPYTNNVSTTNALVWSGNDWSGGSDNIFPTNSTGISSFDILDQSIAYFANKTLYPKLNQIVIAGHSLGAQTVQRYSLIGKEFNVSVPVTLWIGNPDSFAWLNSSRPAAPANCTKYNNWKYGLADYKWNYNTALVKAGESAIKKNLAKKNVAYAHGLNDTGNDAAGCEQISQGANRAERFLNYLSAFPPTSDDTVDYYPGVGHDDLAMFSQEPGTYRLFLDNFTGNNSRAADFGPRQIPDDNPHPNTT